MRGVRSARWDEGVEGNRIVPFSGKVEMIEAGIAKPRLVGDLDDDDRPGEEGVIGIESLLDAEEDLGDMEANTRVKDEAFKGEDKTGKSARGTIGTTGRLACI